MTFLELRASAGPRAMARIEGLLDVVAGSEPGPDAQFRFPGLESRPWWPAESYAGTAALEAAADRIGEELLAVRSVGKGFQTYRQLRDNFLPGEPWKAMYFSVGGESVAANRALCPNTAGVIDALPGLFGLQMFSALRPGGHIEPHRGPSNCRLTAHLGLVVPHECGLRVDTESRRWEPGRVLLFDDTFEHEAWNHGSETRFVLLLDVWHPGLTAVEVHFLSRAQEVFAVKEGPQDLSAVLSQLAAEQDIAW